MISTLKNFGSSLTCRWFSLLALIAFVLAGHGAETAGGEFSRLNPTAACAAVVAAAQTNHIPMDRIDPLSGAGALHPGDSVTFLGTLTQKKGQTQWLLQVTAAAPDPKQKPAKKPEPLVVDLFDPPMTFESKPVPAILRMFGPYATNAPIKPPKRKEKTVRFSLNENFLSLGLAPAAAALLRWSQATNSAPAKGSNALPANPKNHRSRTLSADELTPDEKRAISATVPALSSYFDIIEHTDGLEDLMMKVVKLPSFWSMIKGVGIRADFSFGNDIPPFPADPKDWHLPASTPVYYFPCLLRLNEQPAVKITLVVTRPLPPLLACGGVVGLLAEKVGEDETYLTLRVVSARCQTGRD